MSKETRYIIAVDIGGTFTDAVIADYKNKSFLVTKTNSTPANPAIGFFNAVENAIELASAKENEITTLFHGSTVATNAILESKGSKTALITTRGFRHVLDIGRAEIPREANLYSWRKPNRPIRPRDIFEIDERIRSDGSIASAISNENLESLVSKLKNGNYQAVAIALLHAYTNPRHELIVRNFLLKKIPKLEVSVSSDVLPVFREYERSMATVMNAMVQPVIGNYVRQLETGLAKRSIEAPMFIMKSNGGVFRPEEASQSGAHMALSGPAAGTNGARFLGSLCGIKNMITLDMGGTSTDISLIRDGQAETTTATRINDLPLALPVIDIHTIGAGGGSIASITANGAILVGPESAGAVPGPAAYGKGGHLPTVTDANLILGRLPNELLDGAVKLDIDASRSAIEQHIATPLSTSVEQAAIGILAIINENMKAALKLMTVERGLNPSDYTLTTFGGAGPVHGAELLRLLQCKQLLIPRHPGILCATGLLSTDLRYDLVQTKIQRFGNYQINDIAKIFNDLLRLGTTKLDNDNIPQKKRKFIRSADLRYAGQGTELNVPFKNDFVSKQSLETLLTDFHDLHRQLYSFSDKEAPVEIVNFRLTAIGKMDHLSPPGLRVESTKSIDPDGYRSTILDNNTYEEIPLWRRDKLVLGQQISGPAIIDQLDTTTIILFGQKAEVDKWGNILITEKNHE